LGFKKAAILKSASDETRNQSVAIDLTLGEKPFSLDEIIKRLPAKLGNNSESDIMDLSASLLPSLGKGWNEKYDFIILLGEDLEKIYSFEEDSLEDLNNTEYKQMYFNLLNSNN